MFAHVSIWGILLAAVAAMIVGTAWYSSALFGKTWMKAIGTTEKDMSQRMGTTMPLLIIVSLVTAYALSLITAYLQHYTGGSGFGAAVDTSLLAGIGFGATAVFAHGAFEPRDKKVMYINAGNRIVTLLVMGLVIGAFTR